MTCKPLIVASVALALAGCATPRYHTPERTAADPAGPVTLPAWPDGRLIVCPRGDWDPQARCPWGSEWIAYDSKGAAALEQFAIAGQANTQIADLQADEIRSLDAEAAERNETAAALERELNAQARARFVERLGWIGAGLLLLAF